MIISKPLFWDKKSKTSSYRSLLSFVALNRLSTISKENCWQFSTTKRAFTSYICPNLTDLFISKTILEALSESIRKRDCSLFWHMGRKYSAKICPIFSLIVISFFDKGSFSISTKFMQQKLIKESIFFLIFSNGPVRSIDDFSEIR